MKYKDFIENKYTEDFDTSGYYLDDLVEMFVEDSIVDETILNEINTRQVVTGLGIGLMMKLKQQRTKVKQQKNTNDKLDELSVLVQMTGYGGLLGGFIGNKNNKILSKMRGIKGW